MAARKKKNPDLATQLAVDAMRESLGKMLLIKRAVVAAGMLDERRVVVDLDDTEDAYRVRVLTPDMRGVVRRFLVKP